MFKQNTKLPEGQSAGATLSQPDSHDSSRVDEPKRKIVILGKEYPLYMSFIMIDGQDAQIGASMTHATFECCMVQRSGQRRQICGTKITILADLVPSGWSCPVCGGLLVVTTRSEAREHPQPDF